MAKRYCAVCIDGLWVVLDGFTGRWLSDAPKDRRTAKRLARELNRCRLRASLTRWTVSPVSLTLGRSR